MYEEPDGLDGSAPYTPFQLPCVVVSVCMKEPALAVGARRPSEGIVQPGCRSLRGNFWHT
jgi:hypothetical protein